jgi:hypothetical protein
MHNIIADAAIDGECLQTSQDNARGGAARFPYATLQDIRGIL